MTSRFHFAFTFRYWYPVAALADSAR